MKHFRGFSVTDESETSAFDSQSSSIIRLNNSTIIFMKEVSNVLALICIWREENFGKSGKPSFTWCTDLAGANGMTTFFRRFSPISGK
jgi:hypothetical protein